MRISSGPSRLLQGISSASASSSHCVLSGQCQHPQVHFGEGPGGYQGTGLTTNSCYPIKLFNLTVPQFLYLKNRAFINSSYLVKTVRQCPQKFSDIAYRHHLCKALVISHSPMAALGGAWPH